jgi:hypothetical protein
MEDACAPTDGRNCGRRRFDGEAGHGKRTACAPQSQRGDGAAAHFARVNPSFGCLRAASDQACAHPAGTHGFSTDRTRKRAPCSPEPQKDRPIERHHGAAWSRMPRVVFRYESFRPTRGPRAETRGYFSGGPDFKLNAPSYRAAGLQCGGPNEGLPSVSSTAANTGNTPNARKASGAGPAFQQ